MMTPRRAAVLALNLPAGAAVWASCGFDNAWSVETHMLAGVTDVLLGANWQRGGGKGAKPASLPRPGDESRIKARMNKLMAQAAKFKARQQLIEPVTPVRTRDARGRFVKDLRGGVDGC